MLCVVKADAYGHGLIPVARTLVSSGAGYFGVASIDEGITLRQAGIRQPILVLGLILASDADPLVRHGLTATVCDLTCARELDRSARLRRTVVSVHVKVDTGMGRIGVFAQDTLPLLRALQKFSSLRVEGIFTHFPSADTNSSYTRTQTAVFESLVDGIAKEGMTIPLVHAANSMATVCFPKSRFTMVRPGLALYGLYPRSRFGLRLKPVLSLKSTVVFSKRVGKGFSVSYGSTYTTGKPATIITIPIGYGDGYPRNLSGKAQVLLHGKRFPIAGRICMDQIMCDVGNERARVGDEVVLIGSQARERITAEELARLAGTIPYEIVCGLGSRIPRVYIET
jgi:alanine racemase